MAVSPPARIRVEDETTEAALDEVRVAVIDLLREPFMNARTMLVTLPDATLVKVKHQLGRMYTNFYLSPPKGVATLVTVGMVQEMAGNDPSREIWLQADGYGATITVRLTVF